MADPKYISVMLVPDGAEPRLGWRMRSWQLKTLVIGTISMVVGIILFFAFYGSVLSRAAMTDQLRKENDDLKRYYYKVQVLEQNLTEARQVVSRMTKLAGIDYEFPDFPNDSTLFAALSPIQSAVVTRGSAPDWTWPAGLPVQGFVTQDFSDEGVSDFHPGIDIACAIGTPVLATGSGLVEHIGYDSIYGHMVVLRHNDSVASVYGHNQELLVTRGQQVLVGSRVALSGNSGQSSAPHLHYEVRINDEPINPLDNPYDQEN